jgi:hypothetical protein
MSNILQIGDDTYEVTLFTTSRGISILRKLTKTIGPSMAALFEAGSNEFSLDDQGPFTKAISLLADNIDKEDVVALLKDLLSNTTKNGKAINFDVDFMGKLVDLFKVAAFAAKVNLGDFSELGGFVKQ